MTTTPPTDQQLDELETLAKNIPAGPWTVDDSRAELRGSHGNLLADLWDDRLGAYFTAVHAVALPLVNEIRRLRDRVAELETYAHGCDAEGCVIPHSSWCEAAKKTAADNDGCTCGQPWADQPQPHAMHCWTVNPPRAEVEEMRREIARLQAERDGSPAAPSEPESGTRPCGHDDYHDPHEWADRPGVWCPGHSTAAEEKSAACGKCKTPFDPADTRFDGHARYGITSYCNRCIDRCHENSDAFHVCVICK